MKRLLSSLLLLTLLAVAQQRAGAQDYQAPPPPDQGGPAPDQGGYADQGAPQDQGGPGDQGNDPGVSYQTFYDNLSDQGTWIQTNDYGYVFQPTVSDPNWAPYSDGHWVYTDEGWTWLSDEPWGWATYHYGRWANIDGEGWVWVPGYRWAPAWVSWRYGGGYCGWAPLPPATFVGVEFGGPGGFGGFHFGGDVDVSFGIGAGFYNFVPVGRFGDRNLGPVIVNRYNNYTIINRTTNITNIRVNRDGAGRDGFRGVNVGGPQLNEINAHSDRKFQTMRLAESNGPGRGGEQGNSVSFYNPRVNAGTMHQARPTRVARTINNPAFNRGDSITKPLAVNSHIRPQAASPELVQQARLAQRQAPPSAKIATDRTPVRSAHINTMKPVAQGHIAANGGMNHAATATQGGNPGPGVKQRPQVENQGVRNAETAPGSSPNPEIKHTEKAAVHHPHTQVNGDSRATDATPAYHPKTQGNGEIQHTETHTAPVHRDREEHTSAPAYHSPSQVAPADRPHAQVQHAAGPRPEAKAPAKEQGNKKDDKKP